jgi:hypothetical protein
VADEPVRGHEPAAGFQDTKDLDHQVVLVGDVNDGILGKDDVEGFGREGQRTGGHLHAADPVRQSLAGDQGAGVGKHAILDINAADISGAVVADEGHIDAARAAADVEHRLAREMRASDEAGHFIRPAG